MSFWMLLSLMILDDWRARLLCSLKNTLRESLVLAVILLLISPCKNSISSSSVSWFNSLIYYGSCYYNDVEDGLRFSGSYCYDSSSGLRSSYYSGAASAYSSSAACYYYYYYYSSGLFSCSSLLFSPSSFLGSTNNSGSISSSGSYSSSSINLDSYSSDYTPSNNVAKTTLKLRPCSSISRFTIVLSSKSAKSTYFWNLFYDLTYSAFLNRISMQLRIKCSF